MKVETFFVYSYREIEEIIQKEFRRPDYELIPAEEWSNDQDHSFYFKEDFKEHSPWEKKDLDNFECGKGFGAYHFNLLLRELINRGKLPKGNYLVEVR